MTKRAAVFGGGGIVGIAWEVGVLVGLADEGVDVRDADMFVGTSAGSVAASLVTSGISLQEMFQRQVDPALQAREIPAQLDLEKIGNAFTQAIQGSKDITEILQRIGELALREETVPEAARLEVMASRLPVHSWPQEKRLLIVAVDAVSGQRIAFERESGVKLLEAVAASCAIPMVWPAVTIGGHRYIDGGTYSNENADLAVGAQRVLVIRPETPPLLLVSLDQQLDLIRQHGGNAEVIVMDEATKAVLAGVGGNPLDLTIRGDAARAGREQGRRVASQIASFWQ